MWEHALCRPEHGLTKVISRTRDGFTRAANGHTTDRTRTRYGRDTGCKRAIHGRLTVGGVERVACRAGASVFVGCSFCVRSLPVWRSSCVGSCGVRARRQIARRLTGGKPKTADCGSKAQGGGLSTGQRRTSDGRRTGGHSSDADILRHSEMGGGAAADLPRACHGLLTDERRSRGDRPTTDGRTMGGLRSDLDKPRRAKMGGGRLRGTRTGNGLAAR